MTLLAGTLLLLFLLNISNAINTESELVAKALQNYPLLSTRTRNLATKDEDHVVDVILSYYSDKDCNKPIAEKGEPIISHMEIDSSEEYAQCRKVAGGKGVGNYYQFYCHKSGNEISGKVLCDSTCKNCLISTDDKKKDGTSDFPLSEMTLDKCIPLGELDGVWIKFVGECYDQTGADNNKIVGIVIACIAVVVLFGALFFLYKRSRYNQTDNWFSTSGSGASSTITIEGGTDDYNAPAYNKL
jgi:hypothetical protein